MRFRIFEIWREHSQDAPNPPNSDYNATKPGKLGKRAYFRILEDVPIFGLWKYAYFRILDNRNFLRCAYFGFWQTARAWPG